MRTGLVVATLLLVAGGAAACGDDDSAGGAADATNSSAASSSSDTSTPTATTTPTPTGELERTHVSEGDWCTALTAWVGAAKGLNGQLPDPGGTDAFVAVGVPDAMSDDALAGLQLLVDIARDPAGAGSNPLADLDDKEQLEFLALLTYGDQVCPGVLAGSDG